MRIVGPKTQLKHVKRIEGVKTAAGTSITWDTPIRFEGVMLALSGREKLEYQQFKVSAEYKVYTNYMDIVEKDRVTRGDYEYNVVFVDDKFLMNQICTVILHGKSQ